MDESYHNLLTTGVEKRLRALEMGVMEDIVRRIKKAGTITSTADWQIQRLSILGTSTEDIRKLVSKAVDGNEELVQKLYDEVIEKEYTSMKELYTATGKEFIPYDKNAELQQIVNAMVKQSNDDLVNITKSTGFMLESPSGQKVWTPLAQVYNDYIDTAVIDMINGTTDYNTATRKLVNQLTNSGLRSDHKFSDTGSYGGVDYASSWHNRVDVAARRVLLTGFSQVAGKVTDMNAQRLGTAFFEVSWHGGARPDHAVWQGRVFSKDQLRSVCGLGTGGGLLGWNCRHSYYPFIPGVSERQYSDEWLAEMNAKEAEKTWYRGKEYNAYEATQKQRQIETNLRAYREKVELMKKGGVDSETIMLTKCKYQALLDEYHDFSRKFRLPEQLERVYTGRTAGRIAQSRQTYAQYQAEQINKAKERAEENRRKDIRDSLKSTKRSGTIKSLDVDDFNLFADTHKIKKEVSDVITTTIKSFERQGGMYISDVHFGEFYDSATGKPAMFQVFQNAFGLTEMNINSKILGGKTVEEIDAMLAKVDINLPVTIEEALVHECGHAKAYYRKSASEVEEMNTAIANKGVKGISYIAEMDGAECIAETEVLLFRNSKVPEEAMKLYRQCVKGTRK